MSTLSRFAVQVKRQGGCRSKPSTTDPRHPLGGHALDIPQQNPMVHEHSGAHSCIRTNNMYTTLTTSNCFRSGPGCTRPLRAMLGIHTIGCISSAKQKEPQYPGHGDARLSNPPTLGDVATSMDGTNKPRYLTLNASSGPSPAALPVWLKPRVSQYVTGARPRHIVPYDKRRWPSVVTVAYRTGEVFGKTDRLVLG